MIRAFRILLAAVLLSIPATSGADLGTAFTYQGRLLDGGAPATGAYDLRFTLHNALSGGAVVAGPIDVTTVQANAGALTTPVDFGAGVFPGEARWLAIEARRSGTADAFTPLLPRQPVHPTPHALYASVAGDVPDASIRPADLDLSTFNGTFWTAGGNAGTNPASQFLGTTDNQGLTFRVNNQPALRLEPTAEAPNLVAGDSANSITFSQGAVIGGGKDNAITGGNGAQIGGGFMNAIQESSHSAIIAGGRDNSIAHDSPNATIGGGKENGIGALSPISTVAGGDGNTIEQSVSTGVIGGGTGNTIRQQAHSAVISGGSGNRIGESSEKATIGGGWLNLMGANCSYAVMIGGFHNDINDNAEFSVILGGDNCMVAAGAERAFAAGSYAHANHSGAFVWADPSGATFASQRDNQFAIRAHGGAFFETGPGPGISLNATNRAIITRLYDPFTSGNHEGAGRWGMFMEPHRLTLGIPAISGKEVQVVKYNGDSTYTTLLRVDQSGNLITTGTVNPPSDRNRKTDFEEVDSQAVLEQVAAMPVQTWRYREAEGGERHMGPVAQDFYSAFGLGADDKHIATVDADGVAFAAIQGLYEIVQDLKEANENLQKEVAALRRAAR